MTLMRSSEARSGTVISPARRSVTSSGSSMEAMSSSVVVPEKMTEAESCSTCSLPSCLTSQLVHSIPSTVRQTAVTILSRSCILFSWPLFPVNNL